MFQIGSATLEECNCHAEKKCPFGRTHYCKQKQWSVNCNSELHYHQLAIVRHSQLSNHSEDYFIQFHSCKPFPLLILCLRFRHQISRSVSLQKQVIVLLLCKLTNRDGVHCKSAMCSPFRMEHLCPMRGSLVLLFFNLLSEYEFDSFLNV